MGSRTPVHVKPLHCRTESAEHRNRAHHGIPPTDQWSSREVQSYHGYAILTLSHRRPAPLGRITPRIDHGLYQPAAPVDRHFAFRDRYPETNPEFVGTQPPTRDPLKNKGTLNDGSALARKREVMAKLRQQIPAVVEALQKTQQRYKRNFDSNVDIRNKRVCVGDYSHTTDHQQKNKQQSRTVGSFVLHDADDSTYVVVVNGEERRVNSNHVTPAPQPSTPDETPHPLLNGLNKPESTPPVPNEYVIDRLLNLRRTNGIYSAKVRWFDYGPKDDSWEPLENLPRNLVIRFLRRRKKRIAGYSWSIPTPPSLGTRRSPRHNQAETALVLLIPEFCPGGPRLSCGPTLSTSQMRPWD